MVLWAGFRHGAAERLLRAIGLDALAFRWIRGLCPTPSNGGRNNVYNALALYIDRAVRPCALLCAGLAGAAGVKGRYKFF